MKKLTCIILALLMILPTFLFGCANEDTEETTGGADNVEKLTDSSLPSLTEAEGVKYVLIYNPGMYNETATINRSLNTGKLGTQIDTSMRRADELETEHTLTTISQQYFDVSQYQGIDLSGHRAGSIFTPYSVGDTHDFYVMTGSDSFGKKTFECVCTSEKSNVWKIKGANDLTQGTAEEFGKEFDSKIYDTDVRLFGEPRFADNGHKVNILIYDLHSNGLGGYFRPFDLFASDEVSPEQIAYYMVNTDHAIINVNSYFVKNDKDFAISTVAHEFQHLINFSAYFDNSVGGACGTWINEAMSGFVEDYIYPGIQDPSRYNALGDSDRIRYGQSLYNFGTDTTYFKFDIGVYGSVFLFSTYLKNLAGENVFHKIIDYWRRADASSSDAGSIRKSVPSDVEKAIEDSIEYPDSVTAGMTSDEIWLSKLVLNFYISLLRYDGSDPSQFEPLDQMTLLYDQINASEIEGGGRVIAALKGDKFTVPSDADKGLVYIGLDKDFNVITSPYFN